MHAKPGICYIHEHTQVGTAILTGGKSPGKPREAGPDKTKARTSSLLEAKLLALVYTAVSKTPQGTWFAVKVSCLWGGGHFGLQWFISWLAMSAFAMGATHGTHQIALRDNAISRLNKQFSLGLQFSDITVVWGVKYVVLNLKGGTISHLPCE